MQRRLLSFVFTIVFLTVPLIAQDRAAIDGTVTDASGAVVPGAIVELGSLATGLRRTTVSGPRGLYEFTPLPVGSYTLTINKEGFKPITIGNVDLQYGETRTVDAKLEVGGFTEEVAVTARRPKPPTGPMPRSPASLNPHRSKKSRSAAGIGPA